MTPVPEPRCSGPTVPLFLKCRRKEDKRFFFYRSYIPSVPGPREGGNYGEGEEKTVDPLEHCDVDRMLSLKSNLPSDIGRTNQNGGSSTQTHLSLYQLSLFTDYCVEKEYVY